MTDTYDEHAWLYDAAFSWDVSEEAAWLLTRFGPDATRVLEPACGSGRLLAGLARAGLVVAGFDRSATMLDRARERFARAGLPAPRLIEGDLAACAELALGGPYDGAVMPIGTFGYLPTDDDAARHLEGMAGHLSDGARYFIQFDLHALATFRLREPGPTSKWDTPHERGTLRCSVFDRAWDPASRIATEISRYEILDGPEAGFVHEDEHRTHIWDWAAWSAIVDASPFRYMAAYDGNTKARSPLSPGVSLEGRPLVWHELVRR